MNLDQIAQLTDGFDWDEGNLEKNLDKHGVTRGEIEEVFFNQPLLIFDDPKHSADEVRWYCLGRTDEEKRLFVCFTIRHNLIRAISARSMSRPEKRKYEKA